MKFVKAETNGNDFIIITRNNFVNLNIKKLTNRRTGIGADQVIIFDILSDVVTVDFFNQDGSTASFCGNGLCALTKYLGKPQSQYLINRKIYTGYYNQETNQASIRTPLPSILSEMDNYKIVDTGNKHMVWKNLTPELSPKNNEFNIHSILFVNNNDIGIITWERGVGRTLSCGSGAIGTAFAYGNTKKQTKIIHEGGESYVSFDQNSAILTTSPNIVFEGVIFCGIMPLEQRNN